MNDRPKVREYFCFTDLDFDNEGLKSGDDKYDDDLEKETARENTDHQLFASHEEVHWRFHSASDNGYKVTTEDHDSDDSQTPIAEEQEVTDTSDVPKSQPVVPKPVLIKPVKDLVSPVLDSLHSLGDTVLYSITERESLEDWERHIQIQPEIQSSSIWKPMTSPLGHPNVQLAKESETTSGAGKTYGSPVDLSVKECVKTNNDQDCKGVAANYAEAKKKTCFRRR